MIESLTKRELEVLYWLAKGHNRRGIAKCLGIAPTTVTTHIVGIYQKISHPLMAETPDLDPKVLAVRQYYLLLEKNED